MNEIFHSAVNRVSNIRYVDALLKKEMKHVNRVFGRARGVTRPDECQVSARLALATGGQGLTY
jgi:hypothetical protein